MSTFANADLSNQSQVDALLAAYKQQVRDALRAKLKPAVDAALEEAVEAAIKPLQARIEANFEHLRDRLVVSLYVEGVKRGPA